VYPNYPWKKKKFSEAPNKTQRHLYRLLRSLLPSHVEIFLESKELDIKHPVTNYAMVFDIAVPSYSLALEYQVSKSQDLTRRIY
jgi:hypothetical protein